MDDLPRSQAAGPRPVRSPLCGSASGVADPSCRYDIDKDKGKSGGGKFSTANPKSDVEWRMYHAARMPGPADYTCDIFTVGGRAGSPLRPVGHASPPKTAGSRAAARPHTSLGDAEDAAPVPVTPMHVKVGVRCARSRGSV